jgi:hypothetical protein
VGRLNKAPGLYQNPNQDRHDLEFSAYLTSCGIDDQFVDFLVARPSFTREMKAIGRYGLPIPVFKPEVSEQEILLDWLELEFGPYVEGSRIVEFSEVDFQGSTTPGLPYKWYAKNKRDGLKMFTKDVTSFWDCAHKIGGKVIWHNFCKTELYQLRKFWRITSGPFLGLTFAFWLRVPDSRRISTTACMLLTSKLLRP